jgi:hypothetical protein
MGTGAEQRMLAAAEAGDAHAQFNLGVLHDGRFDDNGHAIKGNRTEALKWLLRAAQQGFSRAQNRLAEMYAEKPDASGNCAKAAFWFQLAMVNLSGVYRQTAQSGYDRASAGMTPGQIAKTERAVKAWKPATRVADIAAGAPPGR